MTATLMPVPVARFFTADGSAPLAGGQVYTYAAGTTTPMASYTDATGLVQNPNPIILDSTGSASIWISGNYKINVLDANSVQQPNYPQDNVADFHTIDNITATSTTSLSISTTVATRIFTTQTDKFFSIGLPVFIVANGAITNNMYGQVTAYSGTQLTVGIISGAGSGTFADWTISLSGPPGPTGSTGGSGAGSGDMIGADNLAVGAGGVANAATARTNLGCGTAATHDVGTSAGQIPILDGSGNMPAVGGTILPTNSANGHAVMGPVTIQWGYYNPGTPIYNPIITFPVAFSSSPYSINTTGTTLIVGGGVFITVIAVSNTQFQTKCTGSGGGNQPSAYYWMAIGPT